MNGIAYDTGALIAAERNDRRMWRLHTTWVTASVIPTVPAPVLAEAWRGGPRQARLARLLSTCSLEAMTEDQARRVGILSGRAAHDDIVDVTVVERAVRRGDTVVTSNRSHIEAIAASINAPVPIEDA